MTNLKSKYCFWAISSNKVYCIIKKTMNTIEMNTISAVGGQREREKKKH